MPLVAADHGQSRVQVGPAQLVWDGSSFTRIDAPGGVSIDGTGVHTGIDELDGTDVHAAATKRAASASAVLRGIRPFAQR